LGCIAETDTSFFKGNSTGPLFSTWDFVTIWSVVTNDYPTLTWALAAPDAPIASPAAGSYSLTQSVTLSSVNSTSIRYTLDGSTPDCSTGTIYSSPISVSSTKTIKAIGCNGSGSSSVSSFSYTITTSGGGSRVRSSSRKGSFQCPEGDLFSFKTGLPCPNAPSIPPLPSIPSTNQSLCVITLTLRIGSRGEQTRCLQEKLNLLPNVISKLSPKLSPDGVFGPKTKAAVILFQKSNALLPDGIFGPKSRAVLLLQ
jgi:hypothetical protein